MEEQAKLGIPTEASFDSAGTPEDQAKRLGEVKALAAEAQRALRAKQDLLGIRVGVNGSAVDEGASGAPGAYEVVTFNPDRKPQQPSSEAGFKTWDEVNGHWTELEAAIAHMEATSPALFALLNAEGLDDDAAKADEAGALAADDDEVALSKLETAMRVLRASSTRSSTRSARTTSGTTSGCSSRRCSPTSSGPSRSTTRSRRS